MGSRGVAVICRTPAVARDWFGADQSGTVYTRTGRRFFTIGGMADAVVGRLRDAITAAGLWAELGDWAALDCEIMPWSLKAEDLVRGQYAAVGAAALAGLTAAGEACGEALHRGADVAALRDRTRERLAAARSYTAVYRHYVWPVRALADVRLAP